MKRKDFLPSIVPLGATLGAVARGKVALEDPDTASIIPPYLKKGDTIGITCPAGFITLEDSQPAVTKMKEWGFTIKICDRCGKKDVQFGEKVAEPVKSFM